MEISPRQFHLGKNRSHNDTCYILGKNHLRKGKMVNLAKSNRETSSRFSLCCFVIYVYIFVLNKTASRIWLSLFHINSITAPIVKDEKRITKCRFVLVSFPFTPAFSNRVCCGTLCLHNCFLFWDENSYYCN